MKGAIACVRHQSHGPQQDIRQYAELHKHSTEHSQFLHTHPHSHAPMYTHLGSFHRSERTLFAAGGGGEREGGRERRKKRERINNHNIIEKYLVYNMITNKIWHMYTGATAYKEVLIWTSSPFGHSADVQSHDFISRSIRAHVPRILSHMNTHVRCCMDSVCTIVRPLHSRET